jgi:hypothetical protein
VASTSGSPLKLCRSSLLTEVAGLSDVNGLLVAPGGFVEARLQFVEESYAALAGKSDQGQGSQCLSWCVQDILVKNYLASNAAFYPRLLEQTASS